jgi:hypothetical protein
VFNADRLLRVAAVWSVVGSVSLRHLADLNSELNFYLSWLVVVLGLAISLAYATESVQLIVIFEDALYNCNT